MDNMWYYVRRVGSRLHCTVLAGSYFCMSGMASRPSALLHVSVDHLIAAFLTPVEWRAAKQCTQLTRSRLDSFVSRAGSGRDEGSCLRRWPDRDTRRAFFSFYSVRMAFRGSKLQTLLDLAHWFQK